MVRKVLWLSEASHRSQGVKVFNSQSKAYCVRTLRWTNEVFRVGLEVSLFCLSIFPALIKLKLKLITMTIFNDNKLIFEDQEKTSLLYLYLHI